MKVTVYLSDGGRLDTEDFDPPSSLDLLEEFRAAVPTLTFDMDGATIVLNSSHVVRIDLEP